MPRLARKIVLLLLASALVAWLIVRWRERQPEVSSRFTELGTILDQAPQRPALAAAAIGFCLLNTNGDVVVERNARTAFIPASSLKTLTTATALEMLGPNFRLDTELRATAPMSGGVISGDLVI